MKKFLSLALSLAMVFSMFTFLSVGASAVDAEATYSDYNTIHYKEAVAVISALDIMGGYSGGTFGPDGNLTRGAATKIICNMMVGPTTANRLPAPSGDATIFFDVPSTHTFAATIAYCAENNFISGYSDGSFHPGDPLSGNAFLKMLLCALGYDQDVEGYRNTSAWATNVVARAVEAGLMDEMPDDFDGRTSLTREQAAELAFETLQADMVEYESNNSTIVINPDGSISSTPVKSNLRTRTWNTSNSNASNINNKGITYGTAGTTGANIVQFEELKFKTISAVPLPSGPGTATRSAPIRTSPTRFTGVARALRTSTMTSACPPSSLRNFMSMALPLPATTPALPTIAATTATAAIFSPAARLRFPRAGTATMTN